MQPTCAVSILEETTDNKNSIMKVSDLDIGLYVNRKTNDDTKEMLLKSIWSHTST